MESFGLRVRKVIKDQRMIFSSNLDLHVGKMMIDYLRQCATVKSKIAPRCLFIQELVPICIAHVPDNKFHTEETKQIMVAMETDINGGHIGFFRNGFFPPPIKVSH